MNGLVLGERPDWEWYQRASEQVAAHDLDAAEEDPLQMPGNQCALDGLLIAPTLQALRGRDRFEACS